MSSTPSQPRSPLEYAPSPEHLTQLRQAKDLGKKIRRAVWVSRISGWSIAVFAALTLLGGLNDGPTFFLGLAMSLIAIIELRNASALSRLDLLALQRLMLNQAAFALLLIAYAGWQLWTNLRHPGLISSLPELQQTGLDIPSLERSVYLTLFAGIVLAALIGPGLTAVYYASRRKYLTRYLQGTADWIIQLQKAGMEV